jgi:hypothetical protein
MIYKLEKVDVWGKLIDVTVFYDEQKARAVCQQYDWKVFNDTVFYILIKQWKNGQRFIVA